MKNRSVEAENLLKLYSLGIDQLKYYNTLIWQFPTVLATLNIVTFNFFHGNPTILLMLFLINCSLLYALYRHIDNSKRIITSIQNVEEKLREIYNEMIPQFKKPKVAATKVLISTFILLNICLLFFSLNMLRVNK